MIVTPKEIDELINNMTEIVARRNKLFFIIFQVNISKIENIRRCIG